LDPLLRSRFYRYLRDNFGNHYPEFPAIFHHVDTVTGPQYLRVKEIFESLESFKTISSLILSAQEQCKQVNLILDLACGHGLVGILLAYRFPKKRVVCVDLEARPAFTAYVKAWEAKGFSIHGEAKPLSNLEYREQDLNEVLMEDGLVDQSSCLVALHACNEANSEVVEGAIARGALWGVMPCCIRTKQYLPACSIELDSDTRYNLLSGAFANSYNAQIVRVIDKRITARPIFIAGGLDRPTSENLVGQEAIERGKTRPRPTSPKRPRRSSRQRNMPPI